MGQLVSNGAESPLSFIQVATKSIPVGNLKKMFPQVTLLVISGVEIKYIMYSEFKFYLYLASHAA